MCDAEIFDAVRCVELPSTDVYYERTSADGYALLGCARARIGLNTEDCVSAVLARDFGLGAAYAINGKKMPHDNRYVYTMWACSELFAQLNDKTAIRELGTRTTDIGLYPCLMHRYCSEESRYVVPNASTAAAVIYARAGLHDRAVAVLDSLEAYLCQFGPRYNVLDEHCELDIPGRMEDTFHLAMMLRQLVDAGNMLSYDIHQSLGVLTSQLESAMNSTDATWNPGKLNWGYSMVYAAIKALGRTATPGLARRVHGSGGISNSNFRVRSYAAWALT